MAVWRPRSLADKALNSTYVVFGLRIYIYKNPLDKYFVTRQVDPKFGRKSNTTLSRDAFSAGRAL
jgi:hypothetical protein